MKLKHWQGYGSVTAKRLSNTSDGEFRTLVVQVTGDHEYGLVRDDAYDVFNWLVRRFAKDCPDYRHIARLLIREASHTEAIYTVKYRPGPAPG